uniref:Shugoshin C-terminal domain-containing protein n=1 Tax=Panagrolaimus sp. PS1159 TaxID=55785 RepID=A0AC35F7L5_9BILA
MNEPSTSSFNGTTNHPAIASVSEDPPFLNKQILEHKSQVDEMKLENEKLNQTIKNQKDLICSQAMTIMELQNNLGNRGDNLLESKSMEDKLATMKAVETDLRLKNAELELKVEAERKMHIELTLVKDNQILQLQRENEANVKKIKNLEENITHITKLKEEETNAIIAAQRKVIQGLKNELGPSSKAGRSNQQNGSTPGTPSISNNNDRQPKTPSLESHGLRSRRNMNGEKSTRRSSRSHLPVNYADDDDSDNSYVKSKPGPSRKLQSNSRSITSRSTSKTPLKQIHSDTVVSSSSGDEGSAVDEEEDSDEGSAEDEEEDSDYAVNEEEDDEPEYEEEKVEVKPVVSSEFEDTDVGAQNSSAIRKNTTRRKRFGSHDSRSSTASTARNIQASNRKRKAETPPTEPKKLRPRLALRSETNRHYIEDGDYQGNESDQEPQNVRRSRRAKPIVNYEETKVIY